MLSARPALIASFALLALVVISLAVTVSRSSATHGGYWHTTEIASVASDGTVADSGSAPEGRPLQLSEDGRFVVFSSDARNLVSGFGGVFLRDRATDTTELVSVADDGTPANGGGSYPDITPDGRYVVFGSFTATLVPGDTNGKPDIFIRDRVAGTTRRVSLGMGGAEGNGESNFPDISENGRFVVFSSDATNLVPGDTNDQPDLFLRDLQTSATERISVATDGTQANGESDVGFVSDDGRFIVFESEASNLVPGDTNDNWDAFLRDRQLGATTRISLSSTGAQLPEGSFPSDMTPDGRFVLLDMRSDGVVPGDANGSPDAFLLDRQTGALELVSTGLAQWGDGRSYPGALSGDARFVAFSSHATNLVAGDTNGNSDVFVYDRATGVTEIASIRPDGSGDDQSSDSPGISGDGRVVAYRSWAVLFPQDTNGVHDVLVAVTTGPAPIPARWGDFDCLNGITIGDAQKIARDLIDIPVTQGPGCPAPGAEVTVDGTPRMWGDLDCQNGVTIGDAQKTARDLIDLPVSQADGCPRPGDSIQVQS
ncbi:MAG: calcium-binding protein [Dehalococcoidia bacterium]|nr:calcium-binding protein [Dehalococcoidia bacterium]